MRAVKEVLGYMSHVRQNQQRTALQKCTKNKILKI